MGEGADAELWICVGLGGVTHAWDKLFSKVSLMGRRNSVYGGGEGGDGVAGGCCDWGEGVSACVSLGPGICVNIPVWFPGLPFVCVSSPVPAHTMGPWTGSPHGFLPQAIVTTFLVRACQSPS